MSTRVKGQEVELTVVGPQGRETSIDKVVSATVTFMQDILSQGFLNETSDEYDDIFKGVSLEMELQLDDESFSDFINRVKLRAQRRAPAGEQFNALMTLNFPNGQRRRISLENLFFGEFPIAAGGREEYVTLRVTANARDGRFL